MKQKRRENLDLNLNMAQQNSSHRIILDKVERDRENKETEENIQRYKQHLQLTKLSKLGS